MGENVYFVFKFLWLLIERLYIYACSLPGEVVKSKSPAEFFADNQNIAGFDNVSVIKSNCDASNLVVVPLLPTC